MVGEDGRWGKAGEAARGGLIWSKGIDGSSGTSELEWRLMGVLSMEGPNSGTAGGMDIAVGRSAISMVKMCDRGPRNLRGSSRYSGGVVRGVIGGCSLWWQLGAAKKR